MGGERERDQDLMTFLESLDPAMHKVNFYLQRPKISYFDLQFKAKDISH